MNKPLTQNNNNNGMESSLLVGNSKGQRMKHGHNGESSVAVASGRLCWPLSPTTARAFWFWSTALFVRRRHV